MGHRGLQDFIVEDATGAPHFVDSRFGGEYPMSALERMDTIMEMEGGVFAASPIDWRAADFLKIAGNIETARQLLEAFRRTFRPFVLGKAAIVVAAGVGTTGNFTVRVPGNTFYFVRDIHIGFDPTLSVDWTFNILRSNGYQLIDTDIHVQDVAGESGFLGGSIYTLPRRTAFAPNEELTVNITNNDAANAINADFHFSGRRVAVARKLA